MGLRVVRKAVLCVLEGNEERLSVLDSLTRFLHWLVDPDIDTIIAWLPFLSMCCAFYLWGKFVRWRGWDKPAEDSVRGGDKVDARRRLVIGTYLLLVTAACTYLPWKATPSPQIPERDLGYGWLWSGPRDPLGPPDLAEVARQASEDEPRAREEANRRALAEGRTATEQEIQNEREAIEVDRDVARESSTVYWRRLAHPDCRLVGLTLTGLTALAGAVFVIVGQTTKRAWDGTEGRRV
jgi:hypothetical protein